MVARPALCSQIRPGLVLAEHEARQLLITASHNDVSSGGCFSAGPAGVQVWDRPFDGIAGGHGSAVHLGSVDWMYNTPAPHYVTIYRAMVTSDGVNAGETTASMLARVLSMADVEVGRARLSLAAPPVRDPFHAFVSPVGVVR
ncbi:MAG: hypothetical protein ACRDTS_15480 [Mycobacterium sp.]